MTTSASAEALDHFHTEVTRRLGLRFDENRCSFLAEVLERRARARRLTIDVYVAGLRHEADGSKELGELARELTVGETYFFRHADQFQALREVALPERISARAATRRVRILSAACASGEEAYSLEIMLRERGIDPGFEVTVQGFDLNPGALERARKAVYSPWSLRETPRELQERWFEPEGRDFRLVPSVREAVRFDQHNLLAEPTPLLAPGSFDIVLCRNALMYFSPEQATRALANLASALAPGGFLFVGHAETLRGLSHDFHLRHTHNAFYYQLKDGTPRVSMPPAMPRADVPPAAPAGWVGSWVEQVERSSEKIRQLSRSGASSPEPTRREAPPAKRDLSEPMQLLRSERFAEAIELLQEPTGSFAVDPAALLLRAALQAHHGSLVEAQQTCHELLRLDDLNAGAHYLLALCCEKRGDLARAKEHDQTASYLDAGFAMPHLHLGLMARRSRDTVAARHALERALLLLEREDESRLLLFGGGFGRGALVALCRSELSNLKGAP